MVSNEGTVGVYRDTGMVSTAAGKYKRHTISHFSKVSTFRKAVFPVFYNMRLTV